jgi:hypothetical protein
MISAQNTADSKANLDDGNLWPTYLALKAAWGSSASPTLSRRACLSVQRLDSGGYAEHHSCVGLPARRSNGIDGTRFGECGCRDSTLEIDRRPALGEAFSYALCP